MTKKRNNHPAMLSRIKRIVVCITKKRNNHPRDAAF